MECRLAFRGQKLGCWGQEGGAPRRVEHEPHPSAVANSQHSLRNDGEVQLLGFDLLELNGDDLRCEPLDRRKTLLAKLLCRSQDGIQIVEHIEAADGTIVFEHAWDRVEAARCTVSPRPMPGMAQDQAPPASPAARRIEDGPF